MNFQKDKRGRELIKLLCIPDHNGEFSYAPDLLQEMYEYCKQDIIAERYAAKLSPPLTDEEHLDWCLVEKTNDRGLKIDRELATAATAYHEVEIEEISKQLLEVTGGEIANPHQHIRIKKYLLPYTLEDEEIRKALSKVETDRRSGEEKRRMTCDVNARAKLLDMEREQSGRLPLNVKSLIELLDQAGRSSVAKYRNMVRRADDEDRVRGAYIFAGASQTGRCSSHGIQFHNLPRGK